MPVSCSAYGCANRQSSASEIHFFNRPNVLRKWIHAVRRKNFKPTKASRICSTHFKDSDFLQNPGLAYKKLKEDAVPSDFPSFPDHLQPKKRAERKSSRRNNTQASTTANNGFNTSIGVTKDHQVEACLSDKSNCSPAAIMEVPDANVFTLSNDANTTFADAATITDTKSIEDRASQTYECFIPRTLNMIREENRVLKQHVKRQRIRIQNLQDLMATLRRKHLVDGDYDGFFKSHFQGVSATIFANELKNGNGGKKKCGNRYSDELKRFALTLHYNSPRAYKFCRRHLALPHPATISAWISAVGAKPGFMEEVLSAVSHFPDDIRDVNLIIDAMSIRKFTQWDRKGDCMWGYCNYGQIQVESSEREATEALVIMCASIKGSWKLPIAYFFQDKCSAELQGELIKTALHLCDKSSLRVRTFTCDGTSTNWSSLRALGFLNDFDTENIQFELKYEYNGVEKTVYFTPDACHAAKLARNAMAEYKQFCIDGEYIKWEYIENLHALQDKLKFKFANKLSATHISFKNSVMKVKYAVQVLSSSVADAIEFLDNLGLPDFQNSRATVLFLRTVDRVFDFLNSRSPYGKGYKRPVNANNIEFFERESKKWIAYFLKLKTINGQFVYQSPRKTFVIAFVTCIKSILAVSRYLLKTPFYKYILTYKFSQDLLELFFGIIRLRFGCNNNPTAYQFYFAMKTILLKNDITPSDSGNAVLFSATEGNSYAYGNFLTSTNKRKEAGKVQEEHEDEFLSSLLSIVEVDPTGILRDFIVFYICGFIVRKLTDKIDCARCKTAILKRSHFEHNYAEESAVYEKFTRFKNRGGLVLVSEDVFRVAKECENQCFLYLDNVRDIKFSKIILAVQSKLIECDSVFKNLDCDSELFANHKLNLIQSICAFYLKIRIYSLTAWKNSRKVSKRKAHGKAVLFSGD